MEEEHRDVSMRIREVIEEDCQTIIEIIDSRAFDSLIGCGHVWTAVNRWDSLEKEVASPVAVELLYKSACVQSGLMSRLTESSNWR